MLLYPARLIPAEDGLVLVRFPDVPEAAATGRSEVEALDNARPVLSAVLRRYLDEDRPLPCPSDICGAPTVEAAGFDRSEIGQGESSGRVP